MVSGTAVFGPRRPPSFQLLRVVSAAWVGRRAADVEAKCLEQRYRDLPPTVKTGFIHQVSVRFWACLGARESALGCFAVFVPNDVEVGVGGKRVVILAGVLCVSGSVGESVLRVPHGKGGHGVPCWDENLGGSLESSVWGG